MKSLSDVEQFYAPELHVKKMFLLREYLQYEILKIIFTGKYAERFTFLGGTCLRIGYGTTRFSEDLDFDNVDLTQNDFESASEEIKSGLEQLVHCKLS